MAVMKVCCGCLSTRSGTLAILLLYLVVYIAGIVLLSIQVGKETSQSLYTENVLQQINCTSTENWWCKGLTNIQYDVKAYSIVAIIILALFVIFDLIALFGTGKGTFWPLLPWIVMEFVRLFAKLIFFIMVIIVWAIYMGEGKDTSNIIATGVIGAAVMAFFYYLWLCVVSYFQLLREIHQIGNLHKVQDSPSHKVTPFVASDYDNENPYDNMSQHTTKESLDGDDVTSVKGEADTKSTMPDGTADATSPAEANE